MYTITYRSVAKPSFNENAIRAMLLKAKENNQRHNITGCLLYHNQKFVQLIEGEEDITKKLYGRILKDSRHNEINMLYSEALPYRLFDTWSLVFNNLDSYSDQVRHKRMLFESIFHQSSAVQSPSNSKLALWTNVYDILNEEGALVPEARGK